MTVLADASGQLCFSRCLHMQMHTTPAVAREFGSFKQRALLALGKIIEEHGAKFAMPTQVSCLLSVNSAFANPRDS